MKSNIKISHVHLETPLVLSEEFVQLLIIENPNEFYQMVTDLNAQFEGEEKNFTFVRDGEIISAQKYGVMVTDVFNFDINDKKILNLLFKQLESVAFGDKISKYNELCAKTVSFLDEVSFSVPFSLCYSEAQPIDYFKTVGLKFLTDYDSLEEKIVCYINALIELKKCEFFIFVNLKSVLNDQKLKQIYAHCRAEQVGLLLIENPKNRQVLEEEKAVIITEDLCEILENYKEI